MSLPLDGIVKAVDEAKRLAKPRRFTQSVELIAKLKDIDLKRPENRFNLSVRLPHMPPEKLSRVCVIASGGLAVRAREAGADMVLLREDIDALASDKRRVRKIVRGYDFFLASVDLMAHIGRALGRFLGPRGKMPQPVPPTADIAPLINHFKHCVRVRVRDQPLIMCRVGLENQPSKDLAENIGAIFTALEGRISVPQNIERVYVKLTMGPAVRIKTR